VLLRSIVFMDEVQAKRETVVITKRGKPVAKLIPADNDSDDISNLLRGSGDQPTREIRATA
jgi:prevent-host-death family protein